MLRQRERHRSHQSTLIATVMRKIPQNSSHLRLVLRRILSTRHALLTPPLLHVERRQCIPIRARAPHGNAPSHLKQDLDLRPEPRISGIRHHLNHGKQLDLSLFVRINHQNSRLTMVLSLCSFLDPCPTHLRSNNRVSSHQTSRPQQALSLPRSPCSQQRSSHTHPLS